MDNVGECQIQTKISSEWVGEIVFLDYYFKIRHLYRCIKLLHAKLFYSHNFTAITTRSLQRIICMYYLSIITYNNLYYVVWIMYRVQSK